MLRTVANQRFFDDSTESATSLLTAAHDYAPLAHRRKTAQLLAVCNLRLEKPQKALEYLEISSNYAATLEQPSSSIAPVIEMCAALLIEDDGHAQQGKK